jgi:FtsZ-binding cell division protein ZapB
MQTIEEYKAYTRQLENEVGKWHHAYDALMVERNQLAGKIAELEKELKSRP